ncbi:MAG: hypothetical protein ACJAZS_000069 [Alteromonas naphthalenivorans]|jgi:hypothetical protein
MEYLKARFSTLCLLAIITCLLTQSLSATYYISIRSPDNTLQAYVLDKVKDEIIDKNNSPSKQKIVVNDGLIDLSKEIDYFNAQENNCYNIESSKGIANQKKQSKSVFSTYQFWGLVCIGGVAYRNRNALKLVIVGTAFLVVAAEILVYKSRVYRQLPEFSW